MVRNEMTKQSHNYRKNCRASFACLQSNSTSCVFINILRLTLGNCLWRLKFIKLSWSLLKGTKLSLLFDFKGQRSYL